MIGIVASALVLIVSVLFLAGATIGRGRARRVLMTRQLEHIYAPLMKAFVDRPILAANPVPRSLYKRLLLARRYWSRAGFRFSLHLLNSTTLPGEGPIHIQQGGYPWSELTQLLSKHKEDVDVALLSLCEQASASRVAAREAWEEDAERADDSGQTIDPYTTNALEFSELLLLAYIQFRFASLHRRHLPRHSQSDALVGTFHS